VADIVGFEPEGVFDVVLLDRVLHMLDDDAARTAVVLALTIVGAAIRHVRRKKYAPAVVKTVLMGLVLFVVYGRFGLLPH